MDPAKRATIVLSAHGAVLTCDKGHATLGIAPSLPSFIGSAEETARVITDLVAVARPQEVDVQLRIPEGRLAPAESVFLHKVCQRAGVAHLEVFNESVGTAVRIGAPADCSIEGAGFELLRTFRSTSAEIRVRAGVIEMRYQGDTEKKQTPMHARLRVSDFYAAAGAILKLRKALGVPRCSPVGLVEDDAPLTSIERVALREAAEFAGLYPRWTDAPSQSDAGHLTAASLSDVPRWWKLVSRLPDWIVFALFALSALIAVGVPVLVWQAIIVVIVTALAWAGLSSFIAARQRHAQIARVAKFIVPAESTS